MFYLKCFIDLYLCEQLLRQRDFFQTDLYPVSDVTVTTFVDIIIIIINSLFFVDKFT